MKPLPTPWMLGLLLAGSAAAQSRDHEHGVAHIDAALQGRVLQVLVDAPLETLLGFEHAPRNDAQRNAAEALLNRLKDPSVLLLRPDAAAQCKVRRADVEVDTGGATAASANGHVDLTAVFEFDCKLPERLVAMELGWFDAFPRLNRIEARVNGPKGVLRQVLRKPERLLRLSR